MLDPNLLLAAIEAGDKRKYRELLKNGTDPNAWGRVGIAAIHFAALQADVFWLREALKHGGNPNRLTHKKSMNPDCTPIYYCLNAELDSIGSDWGPGRYDNVVELIAAGADINYVDGTKRVACFFAAQQGSFKILAKLLESGADATLRNGMDQSLVDWFEHDFEGNNPVEEIPWRRLVRQSLINKGLLKDKPPVSMTVSSFEQRSRATGEPDADPKGEISLFRAIDMKNKAAYLRLLKAGANPNNCDPNDCAGVSLVHYAALAPDVFWLREALAHKGNPNHITKPTAADIADPRWVSPIVNTPPLCFAVRAWQVQNAVELLAAGAKVDAFERSGTQTACGEAAEHGNYELVVIFLKAGADARLAKRHDDTLIKWLEQRDERYVSRESQVPFYLQARQILIKQGLLMR